MNPKITILCVMSDGSPEILTVSQGNYNDEEYQQVVNVVASHFEEILCQVTTDRDTLFSPTNES